MKASWTAMALLATCILGGCGSQGLEQAPWGPPREATPTQTIALPASYHPGVRYPGMDGAPAIASLSFPPYTHATDGSLSDPVNVLVCASESEILNIISARGWKKPDPTDLWSSAKIAEKTVTDGDYPTAPMSDMALYDRTQDYAFEKNNVGVRMRDHFRMWKTPLLGRNGNPFWAIAAVKDIAVKWAPGQTLPTHEVAPDVDTERDFVASDLSQTGMVAMRYWVQSLRPGTKGTNAGEDEFFTDGRTVVLEMR